MLLINPLPQLTPVNPGTGYGDNDVIVIADSVIGNGGGPNIDFKVNGLAASRSSANGVATTTGGSGTGLTLNVTIAADTGTASAVVASGGSGYAVDDVITVSDALIGGSGAANLTFAVASLGKISIADFIATTTDNDVTTQDINSGNVLNITFDDTTIDAADLVLANSLTDGLITLTGDPTLTGTLADLTAVYAAAVASGNGILLPPMMDLLLTIQEPVSFGGLVSAADLML